MLMFMCVCVCATHAYVCPSDFPFSHTKCLFFSVCCTFRWCIHNNLHNKKNLYIRYSSFRFFVFVHLTTYSLFNIKAHTILLYKRLLLIAFFCVICKVYIQFKIVLILLFVNYKKKRRTTTTTTKKKERQKEKKEAFSANVVRRRKT